MPVHRPIPCGYPKAVVQAAAEKYADSIGFVPGADILEVVESLGGRVVYRDLFVRAPNSNAESIRVRGYNDFDIFIPHETSPARDRFTVAHELGHLFLHYPLVHNKHAGDGQVEMVADRYLPQKTDTTEYRDIQRCEWEANWFAAAFLMPSKEFSKIWDEARGDVQSIARKFFVSTAAAENRASSLGIAK